MQTIDVHVDTKTPGKPLTHFWSVCVGAGRANEGLRAGWLEHLQLVRENCGFQYVRFHGLFHDDMFVCREENGAIVYNWQYIDDLFDRMLETGVRPFVELSFCPGVMRSDDKTIFWWKGWISPPRDYQQWADLVSAAVRHWLLRYGSEEVHRWYFEVWNEANLSNFWSGGKMDYFLLYEVTAKAIKAVDPALPVGGPATSNFVPDDRFAGDKADTTKQITFTAKDVDSIQFKGVWIEDFIAFCAARELPVDFISTHPYPSDVAIHENGMKRRFGRIAEATMRDLMWLRAVIDRSAYPKAEIHLTEWSSSPSPRDLSHDYLPEAAFIVRTNLACLNLVDSLSYWTFTDVFEEEGAGPSILHGGFGLVNYQGLVKPSFHAYRMLNQLGDQVVSQGDEYLVSRCGDSGKITAIMYHYPPEFTRTVPYIPYGEREKAQAVQDTGSAAAVDVDLCGLPANAPFELEVLSCGHGTIMEAWMAQGCPEPPTREQASELNQAVWSTSKEAFSTDQSGRLKIALQLEPWSVALLRQL